MTDITVSRELLRQVIATLHPAELNEQDWPAHYRLSQLLDAPAVEPIGYLAFRDGKPSWDEDCVCEDAVYPVDSDDDRVSVAIYTAPQAQQTALAVGVSKQVAECLAVLRPAVKGRFPQEQALDELAGYLTAPQAQQAPVQEPSQRQFDTAMRQWESWKAYALELQTKLVKYEGGAPMVLNAAQPRKAVKLTGEEVGMLTVFDGLHHVETPLLAEFIRAIEQAVWAKLGVSE